MDTSPNIKMLKIFIFSSLLVILIIVVLSFYGLYSNRFNFFKLKNYIFPILAIIHLLYLYILWFKTTNMEYPDTVMRNIEYTMYFICLVYLFQIIETLITAVSLGQFHDRIIPSAFIPMATLMICLKVLLLLLTIFLFVKRKLLVGKYNHDYLNKDLE